MQSHVDLPLGAPQVTSSARSQTTTRIPRKAKERLSLSWFPLVTLAALPTICAHRFPFGIRSKRRTSAFCNLLRKTNLSVLIGSAKKVEQSLLEKMKVITLFDSSRQKGTLLEPRKVKRAAI
ncbi:hypothetical protein L596_004170 [Steinernema carpocapsae]|uniref:Uncharacterized protein n=1 Tax=Steinernema carpocapsae TaxID=34508 RepID=A0A4U8UV42_STECR|nr:hypothetical protein L596_004170 [Steinernema carpocapsae]